MGLRPQLAAILLCLLACTGNWTLGCHHGALKEIIHILNQVTEKGTPCTEMVVPDALSARKNSTEKDLICRASQGFRKFYFQHEVTLCLKNNSRVLKDLKKLYRGISSLFPQKSCNVNESTYTTLKDFLESLRRIMQKKYWQCGSSTF
uniref:Interleukin-4 n=1 Tax=Mesocricetus auratus TaxID=10036 RepID=IL4_MESAU|nr:RecName: Full=Interleukin-4; Short=IL-4; AltName: Full=B-cell stimulatory factor 1; Short=BSF-1; AltName: Full=Lymphocyte stimulatory factor 1; Flags: Precursor [Mesocricetus auratus]AAA96032.1 interleukin-4 [Cricetinae gen. sp.]